MRNMFVCPCSIKIPASGFDKLLESIFCLLLVVEGFSLPKVVQMLEEVVVGWRGQMNMVDEARLHSPMCSTSEALVVRYAAGRCHGEDLRPFCRPGLAADFAALSASHRFAERTSRCNGFAGIQKAVVDQTGSRPPNSDHGLFGGQVWLWEVFRASSPSNH